MKKKKVSENNLDLNDWTSSKPETKLKIRERNSQMRLDREAKSASINTRIAPSDLKQFKKIAAEKAIPYQTLLGHVLHEYVAGNLVDVKEARKMFKIKAS